MHAHHPLIRRLATGIAVLIAVAALSSCTVVRARIASTSRPTTNLPSQNPAAEKTLLASINALRAAHHVHALSLQTNLVNKARYWALWMSIGNCGRARNGTPNICHSVLSGGISVHWTMLEENVGAASPRTNVSAIANAFAHSAPHLANIVNSRIRYVGVGVAYAGNTVYAAEEFMATS